MEIERINDHTVKFYISYVDIEEKGFDREEIWYNRERSEELFWEMMDEVHQEEDFLMEGPLWIQVQALDKGLEILVTKAQLSKDGQKFELPVSDEKLKDLAVDERVEAMLDQHFNIPTEEEDDEKLEFVLAFNDFEDLISLAKRTELDEVTTSLYSYNGKYYLIVEFPEDVFEEDEIDNLLSIFLEFGYETDTTIHIMQEYGKVILHENVFVELRKYFK
ncbi:adapter protein MecA 1/2 [Cytobacillus horneckiae]|uniref:Adapter protein MecA n=1 Tax=Cytobacillus horneckiae TaxID=549687 RepID=A0A2N0ZF60_9BACI|nr:adaptor protein MecA [Cytobacillus horneckiae]MBN6887532.1 adaptor protein MecA [Cytobacillus horneckiae]MCM3178591.1 adaptor protein MecA [Cytobacillus horneckiae]MEC1155588.1 adaptor protein MecA [Cytobacillus horneckiae]MED2936907.1 adaptor protein MecA [Cytobacillus horneckiae]PKG28144.1 adaptor protein MecA [Cytobacillus horneckiae]